MNLQLLVLVALIACVAVRSYMSPVQTKTRLGQKITRGSRRERFRTSSVLPVSIDDDVATTNAPKVPVPSNAKNLQPISKKKSKNNRNYNKNDAAAAAERNVYIQLNKKIIAAETASDVINLLESSAPDALKKTAGGGAVNSVNFATAIHRIGRHIAYNNQDRASTLSDPKFALFLCSFDEALAGVDNTQSLSSLLTDGPREATSAETRLDFSIRERTNLVWALAKLRLVPPLTSVPLLLPTSLATPQVQTNDNESQPQQHPQQFLHRELAETSVRLRRAIVSSQKTQHPQDKQLWITTLSLLSANLIDTVANMMIEQEKESLFNPQEMVNMLWAFAATQRASTPVFDRIGSILVLELEQSATSSSIPKPQEFSNAIWACATASYSGDSQRKLIELVARYMERDPNWISTFKPQEVSNTAWGIATLLSLRRETGEANSGSLEQEKEDLIVVSIFRCIAHTLLQRCDTFKSQEISNTIWAFGTLGFGTRADKRNVNDFIVLKSDQYESDLELVDQTLAVVSKSVSGRLGLFKEQEMNNLAHGCGRLGRCEPEMFAAIAHEFSRRQGRVTGQDIGTTLWSFATTKYCDKESFEKILSRLRLDAVEYWKPQEISNIAWALGTSAIPPLYPKAFDASLIPLSERVSFEQASKDPITLAFAAVAKELLRRPEKFKTQELKDSLWGLSKAGIRHPLVFRSIAEFLVGRETDKVPAGKLHTGVGLDKFS